MENLSPHLQAIKAWADWFPHVEDKFPPQLAPDDGVLLVRLIAPFASYYFTTKVYIKRQAHPDELGIDLYGNPCVQPYQADRLRNEAAVLQFLAEHTTIPVPKFLDVWTAENGLTHLKTSFVHGAVALDDVEESRLPAAVERVTERMESDILPQLRKLRRATLGGPNEALPVVPPRRVWDFKGKRIFPRTIPGVEEYTFCHTDLGRQNILVDPDTFRIVSVIDRETAGFFPADWDLPLWKANTREEGHKMWMDVQERDLALLGVDNDGLW